MKFPATRCAASLFAVLVACGAACRPSAPEPAPAGGLEVVEPEHAAHPNWIDMGEIPLGETRERTVRLRNRERGPLVVRSLQAGCSCTLASISYRDPSGAQIKGDPRARETVITLPAGVTAELELRVDSKSAPTRNREKLVIVRMVTDSATEPYFTLEVRMKIEADFQAVPPVIDLGRVSRNGGGQGFTELAAIGERHRRLLDVLHAPEGVDARLELTQRGGVDVWVLHARVDPPLAPGNFAAKVLLRATGPDGAGDGAPFEVALAAYAGEDVEVLPPRLLLARSGAETTERATAELFARLPGARLGVVRHELVGADATDVTASVIALEPDADGRSAHWRIELTAQPAAGARAASGTLVLTTDEAALPRIEIPWMRRS